MKAEEGLALLDSLPAGPEVPAPEGSYDPSAVDPAVLAVLEGLRERIDRAVEAAKESRWEICVSLAAARRSLEGSDQSWEAWCWQSCCKEMQLGSRSLRRYADAGRLLGQYEGREEMRRLSPMAIVECINRDDADVEVVLDAARDLPEGEVLQPKQVIDLIGAKPKKTAASEPKAVVAEVVADGSTPKELLAMADDPMWRDGPGVMKAVLKWSKDPGLSGMIASVKALKEGAERHAPLLGHHVVVEGDSALQAKLGRVLADLEELQTSVEFFAKDFLECEGMAAQFERNAPVVCGKCRGKGCPKCDGAGWLPKRSVKV